MSSSVANEYSESETLNLPISEAEVTTAVKRFKSVKACGEYSIINEMIRAFSEDHLHMLTQIFNVVLLSGHIPHDWLIRIIKPIYTNKGDIYDPDNYRGITLLSCLGKLFTSIINERLTTFIKSTQIMSEAQAVLGKAILQPTKNVRLSVLLNYFMST